VLAAEMLLQRKGGNSMPERVDGWFWWDNIVNQCIPDLGSNRKGSATSSWICCSVSWFIYSNAV